MDISSCTRKSLALIFCLFIYTISAVTFAEEPLYNPNRINFNQGNARGLVGDLETYALTVAKKYINRHGSFSPFGIALTSQGEFQLIVGNGKNAKKDLSMLLKSYRKLARQNEIVAAAIVYDTKIQVPHLNKPTNAIYITLDSQLTRSRNGFSIYNKVRQGRYRFKNLQSRHRDNTRIFSASRR